MPHVEDVQLIKPIKKREHNATVKRLQAQAARLVLVLEEEQQQALQMHETHLLLAEAILHHKVMHDLMRPMHRQLITGKSNISNSATFLGGVIQELRHNPSRTDWSTAIQLMVQSQPLLQAALEASPEQVQQLAMMAQFQNNQQIRQITGLLINQLLHVLEMLSPERYPTALLSRPGRMQRAAAVFGKAGRGQGGQQQAGGAPLPAGLEEMLAQEPKQAAAELLAQLQELKTILTDVFRSTMMLSMRDAAHTMLSVAGLNIMTGEQGAQTAAGKNLPGYHYLQAARRLRLTERQLEQLKLMLKQYNRMARQQAQVGKELVSLSESSFSLQTSVSGVLSFPPSTGSGSGIASCSGNASGQATSVVADDATELEKLLDRHVFESGDFMVLVSSWVTNTLTPYQIAEYMVSCYPYFSFLPAIVECAPLLQPCEDRPVSINADCCPAAAQAAALAAELGYMDACAYTERRGRVLEAQLQWALREASHAAAL